MSQVKKRAYRIATIGRFGQLKCGGLPFASGRENTMLYIIYRRRQGEPPLQRADLVARRLATRCCWVGILSSTRVCSAAILVKALRLTFALNRNRLGFLPSHRPRFRCCEGSRK